MNPDKARSISWWLIGVGIPLFLITYFWNKSELDGNDPEMERLFPDSYEAYETPAATYVLLVISGLMVVMGIGMMIVRVGTAGSVDVPPRPTPPGDLPTSLQKLADLRASGDLTEEEFTEMKKRLLGP